MASRYTPDFVHMQAKELYAKFKDNYNKDLRGEGDFVYAELASISNSEDEKSFFLRLDNMNRSQKVEDFFFYDIILVERNLYLPVAFFWALFFILKLGKDKYFSYIQKGALLGLLRKHGYTPVDIQLHFFGIYASVHARKVLGKEAK